jgi:EAL domain-containing protein (putative c-di-GMP-specific phosphodiesterase class I)
MALREPVELPERTVTSSASVGISVFPDDGQTAEELLRNADAALYRAKELGRNAYLFYSPELTARAARRLSLEHNLRRALAHDEFVLHYQPQFDARSGSFTGMEALLRWQSPTLGLVLPEHFIRVAEESQLIEAIGDWVINQACRQARSWLDAGLRPLRIAINVSGRQIPDDRLITHIRAALCEFRLYPEQIQFEIELTETVLVAIEPSRAVLSALRDLGLTIAIDDFGTGYSSLSMLQHLPIDRIKICQDFVRGIPADNDSQTIVEAILALGLALNKNIIAEGVETEVQLAFLRDHGCNEIQGHLFGKAMQADQVARYLRHPAIPP